MSTPDKPKTPRKRIWLRVLFGASLAMNLLVIGLAVGAAFRFGGPDGVRPPPSSFGSAMYRALSPEDRRTMRTATKRSPEDHDARRRAHAETIGAAVRAVPFDAVALQTMLQAQAERRDVWQKTVQTAWLKLLSEMSDEERAAYAERLEHSMTHGKSKPKK